MTMHQMMLAPPNVAGSPPTTYILRDTNSDLGGGADFNKKLLPTTTAFAQEIISVIAGNTDVSRGFTEPNVPGSTGLNSSFTVEVEVTSPNGSIFLSVQLHRVSSIGGVLASSSITAEQLIDTAQVYTFTIAPSELGTWGSTDRLRVDYRFRATGAGEKICAIGLNTVNNEVIST